MTERALVTGITGQDGAHLAEFQPGQGYEVHGIERRTSLFNTGRCMVKIDPRYFRPTEVGTLLGDATKARLKLGWAPETSFEEMIAEMVEADLQAAHRDELCRRERCGVANRFE